MEFEHEICSSPSSPLSETNNTSHMSRLSSTSNLSSITRNLIEKSVFTVIDTNISHNTEMEAIMNIWVNIFKENPRTATLKLFTLVLNCFDIDICDSSFINFNAVLMFGKIVKCFKTMAKNGLLLSPQVVKRSSEVQKLLQLFSLIFHHHSNLFFLNDSNKSYFIFFRDIFIKISKLDFIGPRLLATNFGLKMITGLIQSNNLVLVRTDLNILLKEFLIKRWKDTTYIVRETVLLELKCWIQIDATNFLNDYWVYIYWALGDHSTSIQTVAIKMSENILNMHYDVPNIKLLIKKIISVLANLLLSKNEEVVISALNLYSTLPSPEEDDEEQYMSNIESIALELIFSEKSNIARCAAKHFVNQIVNTQPDASEQMKVILIILRGIPSHMTSIAASFFVDAIYDVCPILTDFKLISQILNIQECIEEIDKNNLMTLLMYVIKWSITGVKPEHKTANVGDQNDVMQLHSNLLKKKEFTTYILLHILNQLRECKEATHAFSLWILLQFTDFKLVQDKMILPEIVNLSSVFYNTWNVPTILEMVSKCIGLIISSIDGYEQSLCSNFVNDIAQSNINTLIAGIENTPGNAPNLKSQKNALIKIWSLAKHNDIPDYLEPLKYLSYYIPYLLDAKNNLIVSEYALNAFMEVLRKKLHNVSVYSLNTFSDHQQSFENTVKDISYKFLDAMFNILSKYDLQVLSICETAFLLVNELLRMKFNISEIQSIMLNDFIFNVCSNCEDNDDLNTIKLIEVYILLIQDGLINMNQLITLLQFIKIELIEHALQPIFNFFCKKETGGEFSCIINVYLVYMFENIISQKSNFRNFTIKDVIDAATIITRLLSRCVDQDGKRLVSTNIHRRGIQYAMSDNLNYPFKEFLWVLTPLCNTLIPYDAQHLSDYFLNKPSVGELINNENEHILNYLYKLQEICDAD